MDLDAFKTKSEGYSHRNASLKKVMRKLPDKKLDAQLHRLHDEAFEQTDCLTCANCCKTTSPVFLESDIERMASGFKMKVSDFIARYLHCDEEGDYVLNEAPCPFLGHDNMCIAYDNRPKACREYPHTNRKKMRQIIALTLRNAEVCPAVFHILEAWKEQTGNK